MAMHTVSKMDACRRQLETAIVLYFQERDFISIHTLAASAHQLVSDLTAHHRTPVKTMEQELAAILKPEGIPIVAKALREARNFFKHADKDPVADMKFDPGMNELFLFDSCRLVLAFSGKLTPTMEAFHTWFMFTHPSLFPLTPELRAQVDAAVKALDLPTLPKNLFLETYLRAKASMPISTAVTSASAG